MNNDRDYIWGLVIITMIWFTAGIAIGVTFGHHHVSESHPAVAPLSTAVADQSTPVIAPLSTPPEIIAQAKALVAFDQAALSDHKVFPSGISPITINQSVLHNSAHTIQTNLGAVMLRLPQNANTATAVADQTASLVKAFGGHASINVDSLSDPAVVRLLQDLNGFDNVDISASPSGNGGRYVFIWFASP